MALRGTRDTIVSLLRSQGAAFVSTSDQREDRRGAQIGRYSAWIIFNSGDFDANVGTYPRTLKPLENTTNSNILLLSSYILEKSVRIYLPLILLLYNIH